MRPLFFRTNTMKKHYTVSGELNQWVLGKLAKNPELYGGDKGNSAIQLAYIQEMNQGLEVEFLTLDEFTKSTSRAKNALLKLYPELDYRIKNKPKEKNRIKLE